MSKIKVGQIYKDNVLKCKGVITWVAMDNSRYFMVRQDGFFFQCTMFDKDMKLIAEYPTWQEAVNSKEFNNG